MANRQLLVVDDSVTMQKVIELALAKTSFAITKLNDFHAVKTQLQKTTVDAVIVNMQLLKGMDAPMIDQMRIRPNRDVMPLIILTGSFGPTQDHVLKTYEQVYFLQKPFDAKDLLTMLSEVLHEGQDQFFAAGSKANAITAPNLTPKNTAAVLTSPASTEAIKPTATQSVSDIIEAGRRGRKAFFGDPTTDKTPTKTEFSPEISAPADTHTARVGASSFSIPPQELERLVNNYLAPKIEILVKKAVDQYCADKFDLLAREVIESELRRLATERARHLTEG